MDNPVLDAESTLAALPPPHPEDPLPLIRALSARLARTVVVLDDDPTGTQTIHDLPVLTTWDREALAAEFSRGTPLFYILTNSRSLPTAEAVTLTREIAAALRDAAQATGRRFDVISRSDSTLRGHYPAETDALADCLGPFDALVLCPFFAAGGRITLSDTHYVREGDRLVPAAATPFARDAAFGYRNSHLPAWVEEKTAGRIPATAVASIPVETIRTGGPEAVASGLRSSASGQVFILNAATPRDVETAMAGLLLAQIDGCRILFRSGAQLVAARGAIAPRPPLRPDEIADPSGRGGLVVVGSYVPKTTAQLNHLLAAGLCQPLEIDVTALGPDPAVDPLIRATLERCEALLAGDRLPLVFTSRSLVTGSTPEESLAINRRVSRGLVHLVRSLRTRPRWLIAKGGITSSDCATAGLGVRRADVLGQLLPGIPVWRCGPETCFPGLGYVVFPGNVGGDDALTEAVRKLSNPA
ncbi:MAG: hypothetical protein EA425_05840 [Puniceicoccaceae bacterium]|nr:MAG: hypothetical protein EA425_05840 [Puniceicoccaceae bacterium]